MLVPIACRFVPYDQWLVTHLDDEWKVSQVKAWILSKCHLQSSGPQTRRSVSPITFAPTVHARSSLDSLEEGYNEDDEYSEQDLPPRNPPSNAHRDARPRSSSQSTQSGSDSLVDRYTLISFSTGFILEDRFSLSWYNLCPYELLEMHPVGTIAPLQRDVLVAYIRPYFQAKVRVLRVVWNHRLGRFEVPGADIQYEHTGHMTREKFVTDTLDSLSPKSSSPQSERGRKTKVNWKARWVVVNQGMLSLCKEHVANPPVQQFALSWMTALRGTDVLGRTISVVSQPRVVCIQFRPRPASSTGVVSLSPSLPSSPIPGVRSSIHEPLVWASSVSDSKSGMEQNLGEKSFEHSYESGNPFRGEGEWVILDMLDDHAFSSILRILHREATQPISSSFAPSSSIVAVSPRSPDTASFSSYETIPYPEWRIHTVENARKAGLGDVGKAMAWVLWSEKGLGESLMGNIRHHRQVFLQEMQYKTPTISVNTYGPGEDSDEESEMEWDGWMRDMERQRRLKQRSEKGRSGCKQWRVRSGGSSQLPSPPASEASSSGSPRVRSPSLSVSLAGMGSFGSTLHGQYRNIGNVTGTHGYTLENMRNTTVSTVSVGMSGPSRRRSSTFSTMTKQDGSKQGREWVSSISQVAAAPGSPSSVRHVRSSSNLQISSPYETDVGESAIQPVSRSPSKEQGTFMRGMSLRASKIVRGLESAIDFVDEKSSSLHN